MTDNEKAVFEYIKTHPTCNGVDVARGVALPLLITEKIIDKLLSMEKIVVNNHQLTIRK